MPVSGRDSVYGAGTGPILLDDLECSGDEANLFECGKRAGSHDCTHNEDAAVVCLGMSFMELIETICTLHCLFCGTILHLQDLAVLVV